MNSCQSEQSPEFRTLVTGERFAMIIPSRMTHTQVVQAAKDQCALAMQCIVLGWTDKADAPHSYPISQQQEASLVFTYERNRATDWESAKWNCEAFLAPSGEECWQGQTLQ